MVIQTAVKNKSRKNSQSLWVNGERLWVIDNGLPFVPLNFREKSKATQDKGYINPFATLSTSQDTAR